MELKNNKLEKQYQNICLWLVVDNLISYVQV